MKAVSFASALLVAILGTVVSTDTIHAAGRPARSADGGADPKLVFDAASLGNQSLWTKVTPLPYYVDSEFDFSCAQLTALSVVRQRDPHASTFINVYVNRTGRPAMFARSVFPVGSVIVKQKFERNSSGRSFPDSPPLLYTIMIKRSRGYNPEVGDWEFAVVAGDGKKLEAKGKLSNCMSCHQTRKEDDFVFRSYPVERLEVKLPGL